MYQTIRRTFFIAALLIDGIAALATAGGRLQERSAADRPVSLTRVRSTNSRLNGLVEEGYRRSPTFRRLADALDSTDLIVYVEPGECDCRRANACLSLAAVTAEVRYVRASVSLRRLNVELIEQIGHELRHALEIAGEHGITSDDALAEYYRTRSDGCGPVEHCLETAAARKAGAAVRAELYRRPERPARSPETMGPAPAAR